MVDWSAHKFVLIWLKENLNNYQYRTEEANQIKKAMMENALESKEDVARFAELYEQFLKLVESNPLTANNADGGKASIFANDFYYYFYPTKQGLLVPLGLQIESAINIPGESKNLQQRLQKTLETWKAQYDKEVFKWTKKPDFLEEGSDYQKVLERSPSEKRYVVLQSVLLILIAFCLASCFLIYRKIGLYPQYSLKGIAFWSIIAVGVFSLLKSLAWLAREKKRRRYVVAWKHLQSSGAEAASDYGRKNFRTISGITAVMERIGEGTYGKEVTRPTHSVVMDETTPEMILESLAQPKKQRVLYTVRPVHVFTMAMAAICCVLCLADVFPEQLGKLKDRLTDKIHESPMIWSVAFKEQAETVLLDMGLQLITARPVDAYASDGEQIDTDTIAATYAQGTALAMVDCYREELEDGVHVWFREKDPWANTTYVAAENVELRDVNEIIPSTLKVLDRDGNAKQISNVADLVDGSAMTAVELEEGDVIQAVFPQAVELKALYMMNGNVSGSYASDSGVYLMDVVFDESDAKRFVFEKVCDQSGYVLSMRDQAVTTLEMNVLDVTAEEGTCWVTELIFCG